MTTEIALLQYSKTPPIANEMLNTRVDTKAGQLYKLGHAVQIEIEVF